MPDKRVIEINTREERSPSSKDFDHRLIIGEMFDTPNRRKFFKTFGIGGALAGAFAVGDTTAQAQSVFTDFDVLNFALNLEYLEAEFYTVATTGQTISQAGLTVSGSGVAGPTSGGSQVALTGALQAIAMEIASDERTHVTLIQTTMKALGGVPIAKPAINLNALGFGFASANDFLTLARIFEDIGVTAYGGAAPLIKSSAVLGYAARILATEAYHASNIRLQLAQANIVTKPLDGADHVPPPGGTAYFPLDANAITEVRTPQQVLYAAFGGANLSSGGFFPGGVNGLFNTSGAIAANTDTPGTNTGTGNGVITATPNPAVHTANGDAMTTISWSAASGVTGVQITIGSPGGPLFASGGPVGSLATGPWVSNGLTFYLQNVTGGLPLSAANTLGTVIIQVN